MAPGSFKGRYDREIGGDPCKKPGPPILTRRAGVRVPSTSNKQMMSGWVRSANKGVAIVSGWGRRMQKKVKRRE
jgi:hypothetical protein